MNNIKSNKLSEERQFMANHDLFVRTLQFVTKFDFFAFLYILKTNHTGHSNAVTSKYLYSEIYSSDFVYEEVTIASDEFFVLDKSSQFREEIKRFIAIQDVDLDTIYALLKLDRNDLSKEELMDIQQCVYNLSNIFKSILGGEIAYYTDIKSKSSNPQRKYYFKPDASESTMDLLAGMILCNQLISLPLKYDLIELMTPMNMAFESPLKDVTIKASKKNTLAIPSESMSFLKNVSSLFKAIQYKYQVEISYGIYEGSSTKEITFEKRSQDIINPYALLWNEGYYYLIATTAGNTKPMHYRVDRIINVDKCINDKTQKPLKREPIPDVLREYFKRGSGIEKDVFQADKYVHEHPGMRLYHEPQKITCEFEIIDWEIQMLVDTFGTDIKLTELKDKDNNNLMRTDYYGRDKKLYRATVNNVQYENALAFCLTHAEYITVTKPERLVLEVKDKLTKILERLS